MITIKPKTDLVSGFGSQPTELFEAPDGEDILNPHFVTRLANSFFREGMPCFTETTGPTSTEKDGLASLPEDINASGNSPAFPDFETFTTPDAGSSKPDFSLNPDYYFLPHPETETPAKPEKPASSEANDLQKRRQDFPILQQEVNGKPLIWLDNAATTQKPQVVIDTLSRYYSESNSNIHRGSHTLANRATTAYEKAREKAQRLLGAPSPEEIIFVRGTTEAINLVAQTYGKLKVQPGDEILLTQMEHHSNIVPWQFLQQEKGAVIKVIPINERGEILLDEYEKLLTPHTKMVAITHVSNVLGTINPVRLMTEMAHYHGAGVLIDGAQAVPHFQVDVTGLDADFYAFSGHKIYGPTGIGVLYGKKALLEEMPPWQGGGSMIHEVTFEKATFNRLPFKFEAGTGNIADAVGLGAAIDYIQNIGFADLERHERRLTQYAMEALSTVPGLRLIGTTPDKISAIAFIIKGISPDEIARHLDQEGIAVRTGHHCAQPVLERFGVKSTVRASLALYNTPEEIDTLAGVLWEIAKNRG
jgi:cysteine desulfurase / selenocysteine lyase